MGKKCMFFSSPGNIGLISKAKKSLAGKPKCCQRSEKCAFVQVSLKIWTLVGIGWTLKICLTSTVKNEKSLKKQSVETFKSRSWKCIFKPSKAKNIFLKTFSATAAKAKVNFLDSGCWQALKLKSGCSFQAKTDRQTDYRPRCRFYGNKFQDEQECGTKTGQITGPAGGLINLGKRHSNDQWGPMRVNGSYWP